MNKASGVLGIGTFEHDLALRLHGGRLAGVDHGRGEQPEAGVMMRVVVPGKEGLAPGAGIGQTAEGLGEARRVLERLELGFGIRVVVGDVRARVALVDPRLMSSSASEWAITPAPPQVRVGPP